MTEAILTSEIVPTVLTASLLADGAGTSATMMKYRGALTPQHLDAPEVETAALLSGVAVHDLGWMRRIDVRGEDRFRWLSGMVTNAVETLAAQRGAYNLVLNAQGRIQGDCCVWRDGESLQLEVMAEQSEALLAHFDRFIIMDDVELVPIVGESALGLTGPEADRILKALDLSALDTALTSASGSIAVDGDAIPVRLMRGYGTVVPHFALWIQTEKIAAVWRALTTAGATPVGAAALELLRVVEGIPAYGVDIQSRDLAQETGQDRALSFTKGCYLGQEIVERVRSRGQVHRHLRSLELLPNYEHAVEAPVTGIELRVSDASPESKAAATITSVSAVVFEGRRRVFAIGMVRAEAEVGNRGLAYQGGSAVILSAPPVFRNN